MGRSIGPPVQTVPPGHVTQSESGGAVSITWVNGKMIHRLKELGFQAEYPIAYQIGAGKVGESYIASAGKYLFQSPVSYYKRYGWDVSPGFKDAPLLDFDRVLGDRCLACHSSNAATLEAINCERCHGQAQQHMNHPTKLNIVNPVRLAVRARDSICEQCHLEGVARILNPGKDWRDFRAGEELETTLSVYVNHQPGPSKAVSHAEQLAASRCARMSAGKLWCGTCHNPHPVKAVDRTSEIRAICTSCHATLTPASHAKGAADCAGCHMPRLRPNDVAHAASTDHRILATPAKADSGEASDAVSAWQEPAVELRQRNLGLAELEAATLPGLHALGEAGGNLLAHLPASQRNSDPAVLAALGDIALAAGRLEESESLFRSAVQLVPTRGQYWLYLGVVLKQKGESTEAAKALRMAIDADGSLQRAYLELSALYAKEGKTREAADVLKEYLKWNPQSILFRTTLEAVR